MEQVEGIPHAENAEIEPPVGGTRIIGPDQVRVSWAEFSPPLTDKERETFDPAKAVVFLPGWPWKADQSVTYPFPQSLAKRSKARTISIDTRVSKIGQDSLQIESAGIALFLKDQGIREVTIVGHSEGAIRAVNLAAVLQTNNPDIKINGVVLANPMGIDNRNLAQLAAGFLRDVIWVSRRERSKMEVKSPEGLERQFVLSLLRDFVFAGGRKKYLPMLKNQLNNLVRINPYLEQIKAPVVVMATDKDLVSDLRRYLPPSDVENKLPLPESAESLNSRVDQKWDKMNSEEQAEYGSKENFIKRYTEQFRSRENMTRLSKARQQHLKEEYFPNAENVVFLVGTKHADHGGIIDFRSETAAHIIYGFFNRLKRQ